MRAIKLFPALFAVSLLSVPAIAQAEAKPPAAAHAKGPKAKGQLEARVLQALKNQGIDDTRAQKVVAILKKGREDQKAVRQDMQKHRQALQALLSQNSTDEGAYQQALDGIEAARRKSDQIKQRQVAEVRKILKPSEQAKVLRLIHKHKAGGGPGKGAKNGKGKGKGKRKGGPRAQAKASTTVVS